MHIKDESQSQIQIGRAIEATENGMSCEKTIPTSLFLWHVNLFSWQCLYLTSRLFRHSPDFYWNKALSIHSFHCNFRSNNITDALILCGSFFVVLFYLLSANKCKRKVYEVWKCVCVSARKRGKKAIERFMTTCECKVNNT